MSSFQKGIGIILRQHKVSEADKFVKVFTRDRGIVTFIARGARKSTSRKSSHLDTLNEIRYEASRGGNPQILNQVETIHHFQSLKKQLTSIRSGFYLSELIQAVVPEEQGDEVLYDHLISTLIKLSQNVDSRQCLVDFQLFLIAHLGFPPPQSQEPQVIITHLEEIAEKTFSSRQLKIR